MPIPDDPLGDWVDGAVDAARFPPDPRGQGRRLYYTGDLARLMPDGAMMVLGRKDRLVKVNGQRMSLLEVEATLQTMPGYAREAVLPWQRGDVTRYVAFLVLHPGAALPSDPGAWLAQSLPRWMVPHRFEVVTELPLLPGGKIDVRSLLSSLDVPIVLLRQPGRV